MRISDWSSDVCSSDLARVQDRQIMPRPRHLTWEESGCYTLTLATAYRMLFGHRPHNLRPGHNVLVWGASGGLGSMVIQLIATAGDRTSAVSGKSVSVRVDLGSRRILQKKKTTK